MVAQYRKLTDLANEWEYMSEFSADAGRHRESPTSDNPYKQQHEAELHGQLSPARQVAIKTGQQIAELARKTATCKGTYV